MVKVSAPVTKGKDLQTEQVKYTVVDVDGEMQNPQDYFIWSLICFFWANPCCLGLAALIHSVKARDRKMMGDLDGAMAHGSTAQTLNIIATMLVGFFMIFAVGYVAGVTIF